jgi:formate hydrogenlyase subunit 3/multisubunit Na+/H+ antiporter MnhD subunit
MPLYLTLACVGAFFCASAFAVVSRERLDISALTYRACAAICSVILFAMIVPRGAHILEAQLPLGLPWIGMRFRIDTLSAYFLAVIDLGGAAASIYAIGYGAHEKTPMRVIPFFPAFLAGMNLVALADDAFTFLVAWEFMSLASWALVIAHHHESDNRSAAYIYLLMASFGGLVLLLAFGILGGVGGAYDFASIRAGTRDSWTSGLVLALAILGTGSKAGLVPLHIWLPLAHPAAPSHVSALMSGVMTKVAVYGFIRIAFDLLGPPAYWWSIEPMTFGAVSALVGVLFANIQQDLKKLLAYSTIENIGVIFIALGLALAFKANNDPVAAALAFTAALFHVFNHALFKSILFFGAGAVLSATDERNIERLGGLIHTMPKTAFLFLGGAIAIAGLPPLNGFASEWLVFQAILLSPSLPQWVLKLIVPAVGVAFTLSAALGAACYIRAYGIAFLGRPRSGAAENAQEADVLSLGAMGVLLGLALLAGVLPGVFIDAISPAASAFVGGRMPSQSAIPFFSIAPVAESRSSYNGLLVFAFIALSAYGARWLVQKCGFGRLRRAPVWDCGYVEASVASQYTASSFAQPIRRTLGVIAYASRVRLDMPLPGETRAARFTVDINDRIMSYAYTPLTRAIGYGADRLNFLNSLSIQEYLAMVFAALVLLLIVVAI